MTERYKHIEYEITDDPDYLFDLYQVPQELRRQFPSLYPEALKGGEKVIRRIKKLIEQYPNVPQLKNYLSVAYHCSDMTEEAYKINRNLAKAHPDYLFGKLNLAFEFFNQQQYDKIPELMGPLLELKELYPGRDTFHIGEITGFYKLAIMYHCATGNLIAAEARYEILEEIAAEHPDTIEVFPHMVEARLKAASLRMEEEDKTRISVSVRVPPRKKGPAVQPSFYHSEIEWLYKNGLRIEAEQLKAILALPRESLISDLNAVIEDSMDRFKHYQGIYNSKGWQEETMNFLVHAVFLLGELGASDSLPKVLETFRQGEKFLDLWYGDMLTSVLWEPVCKLGKNQTDLLKDFVLTPGIATFARTLVCSSIVQMAHHHPQRKKEISAWFREIFKALAGAGLDENIIDSDFIGLAITYAMELQDPDLLPSITKLFRLAYVSEGICGTLLEVARDMNEGLKSNNKQEFLSITDRYHEIVTTWSGYFEEEKSPSTMQASVTKTGRNDPCPCGSGKKYKKCCLVSG